MLPSPRGATKEKRPVLSDAARAVTPNINQLSYTSAIACTWRITRMKLPPQIFPISERE